MVSHAQASWQPIKGNTPMTNENKKIDDNMKIILQDLKPNVFIHGHLHNVADDYKLGEIQIHYLPYRTFRFIDF